jgi:hypothetical protein
VRGATSAAAAISSIVVAWTPLSVNSRSACAWMVRRVRCFFRSRSDVAG